VTKVKSMVLQNFIVLELVDHGSALQANKIYGGQNHRYLNITGRWSGTGTDSVPLLNWGSLNSAQEAAETATIARGRKVNVSSLGRQEATGFKPFEAKHQPALVGYLPYGSAAASKIEAERVKTMRYASAVFNVMNASENEDVHDLCKTETLKIRSYFKGGSLVSASQYLTGKRAIDIAERVFDGELECDEGMSPEKLMFAMRMATNLMSRIGKSK